MKTCHSKYSFALAHSEVRTKPYVYFHKPAYKAWKNVNFPGSLSKFPVGRKLKTIAPLWRRSRNLFSWKHCTQEPPLSLRSHRSTWIDSAY